MTTGLERRKVDATSGRTPAKVKCMDCGASATHVSVDVYGPGTTRPLCEADADYYRVHGETIADLRVAGLPLQEGVKR